MNQEDLMWQGIWNQLQEDKMKPPSQREIKYVFPLFEVWVINMITLP